MEKTAIVVGEPSSLARPVVFADMPEEVLGYVCPTCRTLKSAAMFVGTPLERREIAREEAEYCCGRRPCKACGGPVGRDFHYSCSDCTQKEAQARAAELEEKAFAKAKKVTPEEYSGPGANDGEELYADTVEELMGLIADEKNTFNWEELPPYVWATQPVPFRLDAGYALEHALQDHYEGAWDCIPQKEIDELQELLDAWSKKQNIDSLEPDYSVAIVLSEDWRKAWMKEYGNFSDEEWAEEEAAPDGGE